MNYIEFAKNVQEEIAYRLGHDYKVFVKEVIKNNGVVMQGLLIRRKENNITPTIYLEAFYERYCKGEEWEQILQAILNVYKDSVPKENFDMDFYNDFDAVRKKIAYKLINADRNKELLSKIPHVCFLDLAVCFYYAFSHEILGNGSILVYNSQMDMWKTNTEELFQLAGENTVRMFGPKLVPMEKILAELFREEAVGYDVVNQETAMQILTNQGNMFGAVAMLYPGILQKIAERAKANLFILPSSVHEVIIMDEKGTEDVELFKTMVREVNDNHVLPEEILSYHVYYYNRDKKQVSYI